MAMGDGAARLWGIVRTTHTTPRAINMAPHHSTPLGPHPVGRWGVGTDSLIEHT